MSTLSRYRPHPRWFISAFLLHAPSNTSSHILIQTAILSHRHPCTHSHTLLLSLTLTCPHAPGFPCTLTHSPSRIYRRPCTLTHAPTLTHPLTPSHTLAQALIITHPHMQSLTHRHPTHTLTRQHPTPKCPPRKCESSCFEISKDSVLKISHVCLSYRPRIQQGKKYHLKLFTKK